jgi:hypothetical protein
MNIHEVDAELPEMILWEHATSFMTYGTANPHSRSFILFFILDMKN